MSPFWKWPNIESSRSRTRNAPTSKPRTVGRPASPEKGGGFLRQIRENKEIRRQIDAEKKGTLRSSAWREASLKREMPAWSGDLRSLQRHSKWFNFGEVWLFKRDVTVGQIQEATRAAAIKWRVNVAVTRDIGELNFWLLSDIKDLLAPTSNLEKWVNEIGRIYGPEARKVAMQSLANIRRESPELLAQRSTWGRILSSLWGARWGVPRYMRNIDDFGELKRLNQQQWAAGIVTNALLSAMTGWWVPVTVPIPVVVGREAGFHNRVFPWAEKIAPAIRWIAAQTRGELYSQWKYDKWITQASNELLSEQRRITQARINNALPLRGFIGRLDPELWGLSRKKKQFTELVSQGRWNTPEAFLLARKIEDRQAYLEKKLEKRVQSGRVTKYWDEIVALSEIKKDKWLMRDVHARTAESISEDAGFLVYMGKNLTKDLRLSGKPSIRKLADDIDEYTKTWSKTALSRISQSKEYRDMYLAFAHDTGWYGPKMVWMANNLLGPQTRVKTTGWAFAHSAEKMWIRRHEPGEYLAAMLGTTNANGRDKNLALSQMALFANSVGYWKDNDAFLHQFVEWVQKWRHVQNTFERWIKNPGITHEKYSSIPTSTRSLWPWFLFPMTYNVGGTEVKGTWFIKDACLNPWAEKTIVILDSEEGGSFSRYGSVTFVVDGNKGSSNNESGGNNGNGTDSGTSGWDSFINWSGEAQVPGQWGINWNFNLNSPGVQQATTLAPGVTVLNMNPAGI